MRALVILPTYQEAENIVEVLTLVREFLPEADVLVVDDNSPDGTADLAEKMGERLGGISVLRRTAKAGLGSAYRAGFARGLADGYEVMFEMDSDLSHPPASLPDLLAAVEAGADLAIGSRYVPGGSIPNWPTHRLLLSRWGNRYAAAVLGLRVRDATAGFRAYRATALERIGLADITAEGYAFQIEMTHQLSRRGGLITEVPIAFTDRVRGTSKMSGRIVVEAMVLVTWWGVRDRLFSRARRPSA